MVGDVFGEGLRDVVGEGDLGFLGVSDEGCLRNIVPRGKSWPWC